MKIIVIALIAASWATGAIIPVFNTGLAAEGAVDPNWTVDGASAFVGQTDGFPIDCCWFANGTASRWIMPVGAATDTHNENSTVTFETLFSLAGLDASTAELRFRVAADNVVQQVLLNGNDVGFALTTDFLAFSAEFVVNNPAFFNGGSNVLQFRVFNGPGQSINPTGLRVEIAGTTADPAAPVPEPSAAVLLGAALAGLGVCRRLSRP